jgi:hypothetical protein
VVLGHGLRLVSAGAVAGIIVFLPASRTTPMDLLRDN